MGLTYLHRYYFSCNFISCIWFLLNSALILQLNLPVIVVGCKLDLRDDRQPSLEEMMAPLMQEFREIETCIECSAAKQIQVSCGVLIHMPPVMIFIMT